MLRARDPERAARLEDALREKVNAALKAIKADGSYKRMADRYFDFDISGQ